MDIRQRSAGPPGPRAEPDPAPEPANRLDLARYVAERDGRAFARLVERLGPMVYAVCRRRAVDADEAFQATFLVLAQEADVVLRRWGGAVGAWLHGTACRLCSRQRRSAVRREQRERLAARDRATVDPADEAARRELLDRLDAEINALPRRLQRPLVLCDLVGLSHREAAAELGVSPRTLARQLAGARTSLQRRLSRGGVVVTGGLLTLLLADSARADVPPPLTATAAGIGSGLLQAPGLSAPAAALAAAERAVGMAKYWSAVAAGAVVVGLAVAGLARLAGSPAAAPTEVGGNVVGVAPAPAPTPPATGTVIARGRVVDANGRPVAGIEVLLITRPVRRFPDGRWKPLDYDPLAVHRIRGGMFRELGSILTDADGRYEITASLAVPDPVTRAKWFQTLPYVDEPNLRIEVGVSEFRNLAHQQP